MTAKRFTMTYNEFLTSFEDNGVKMTHEEIVHMLNRLYEDNQRLRNKNRRLYKDWDKLYQHIIDMQLMTEEEILKVLIE